jgi:hypothetical protein
MFENRVLPFEQQRLVCWAKWLWFLTGLIKSTG